MSSEPSGEFLDPFAFPPETNARFNLLIFGAIITVLSLSLTMWATMTLGPNINRFVNLESGAPTSIENWRIVLFVLGAPVVGVLATLALLGLAYHKYRKHPERIIAQKRLEPLKLEQDRNFMESVDSLAKEAELQKTPEILLGPPRAQDGQAFGFQDKPILRLGPSLKVMRLKKGFEPIYRAIVLHEMAHIANEDIQRSYFAEAVWNALRTVTVPLAALIVLGYLPALWGFEFFLWVIFIPITILLISLFVAFELGILFAVLQFIRSGALRVREIYADLRAVKWGTYAGLVQIISSARDIQKNWWQRLWEYHPKHSERLKYLQNPDRLFRLTLDLPLSLGFLLGLVLAGGSPIFTRANQLRNTPGSGFEGLFGLLALTIAFLIYISLIFLLSWLMASSIGLQIQRQTAADQVHSTKGLLPYFRLFLPAFMFQLAFEAGVYFMPYDNIQIDPSLYLVSLVWKATFDPDSPILTYSLISFLILPFWILFAAFTLWFWMGLVRFFASQLTSWTSGPVLFLRQNRSITVIATILLPLLYIPSALARYWLLNPENRSLIPAIVSLPITFVLVLIFCLAVWAWLQSRAK
jgi:hypothetical protein